MTMARRVVGARGAGKMGLLLAAWGWGALGVREFKKLARRVWPRHDA